VDPVAIVEEDSIALGVVLSSDSVDVDSEIVDSDDDEAVTIVTDSVDPNDEDSSEVGSGETVVSVVVLMPVGPVTLRPETSELSDEEYGVEVVISVVSDIVEPWVEDDVPSSDEIDEDSLCNVVSVLVEAVPADCEVRDSLDVSVPGIDPEEEEVVSVSTEELSTVDEMFEGFVPVDVTPADMLFVFVALSEVISEFTDVETSSIEVLLLGMSSVEIVSVAELMDVCPVEIVSISVLVEIVSVELVLVGPVSMELVSAEVIPVEVLSVEVFSVEVLSVVVVSVEIDPVDVGLLEEGSSVELELERVTDEERVFEVDNSVLVVALALVENVAEGSTSVDVGFVKVNSVETSATELELGGDVPGTIEPAELALKIEEVKFVIVENVPVEVRSTEGESVVAEPVSELSVDRTPCEVASEVKLSVGRLSVEEMSAEMIPVGVSVTELSVGVRFIDEASVDAMSVEGAPEEVVLEVTVFSDIVAMTSVLIEEVLNVLVVSDIVFVDVLSVTMLLGENVESGALFVNVASPELLVADTVSPVVVPIESLLVVALPVVSESIEPVPVDVDPVEVISREDDCVTVPSEDALFVGVIVATEEPADIILLDSPGAEVVSLPDDGIEEVMLEMAVSTEVILDEIGVPEVESVKALSPEVLPIDEIVTVLLAVKVLPVTVISGVLEDVATVDCNIEPESVDKVSTEAVLVPIFVESTTVDALAVIEPLMPLMSVEASVLVEAVLIKLESDDVKSVDVTSLDSVLLPPVGSLLGNELVIDASVFEDDSEAPLDVDSVVNSEEGEPGVEVLADSMSSVVELADETLFDIDTIELCSGDVGSELDVSPEGGSLKVASLVADAVRVASLVVDMGELELVTAVDAWVTPEEVASPRDTTVEVGSWNTELPEEISTSDILVLVVGTV
jgi:hypothetical protein